MRAKIFFICMLAFFPLTHASENASLDDKINATLKSHYNSYKNKEYFSGISLSLYKSNEPIKDYYIGTISHQKNSKKIDEHTLFEIGSITKSFTSAIILQLVKENKLKLNDTVNQLLPEYKKWSGITLEKLLNMTSGLPNYSDSPLMNAELYADPQKNWTDKQLIQFIYPPAQFSPPLKPGYFYTNTGYILSALIIENITQHHFQTEIQNRLINPAELKNTFYPLPTLDKPIYDRLASGYGYNPYMNPELLGKDTKSYSLSWAGAAGAVISNSSDIIKWIKALFIDNKILNEDQKKQLMQLISTTSGKPIHQTNSNDPRGFALGVSQGFDKSIGHYWFYEGETEGFRALYMYVPDKGIVISSIFNSAVNEENDHAGELMKKVYGLISS